MNRAAMRITSVLGMALVAALLVSGPADARRGGSFGSRGMRTYNAPPPTRTAPKETAPVQRSMTAPPKTAAQTPTAAGAATQAPGRGGLFGGMGGGLLGGLVAGGLLGALLGHGFGGLGAGLANTLMQVALIGGVAWLLMFLFRRRPAAAPAGFGQTSAFAGAAAPAYDPPPSGSVTPPAAAVSNDIGLTQADRDTFERLLAEVQDAFGREDYPGLRERTTPEVMSYLSEELSQNATQGRRNQVSGTRLLQADVSEAWREVDTDFATVALRYESLDVMVDRQSGAVLSGDADTPTETTELWTFARGYGETWKLSAIQEA